jgi:hypothetical protein
MRYIFILILLAAVTACRQSVKGKNGVEFKSAVEYNDYIVNRQSSVMQDIMDFVKASETNLDSAGNMLSGLSQKMEKMKTEVSGMPAYKGDTAFRNAGINIFNYYKKVFNQDYKQLIDIRKNGGDQTAEGEAEQNRIVNNITVEEEKIDRAFYNAQRDFAQKNKMMLKENEMQKKFDKEIRE